MKEEFAILPLAGHGNFFYFEVTAVWLVEADQSYDVRHGGVPQQMILIRTETGAGEIFLTHQRRLILGPQTFFAVSSTEIIRYRTLDKVWQFSWWAGHAYGALPFLIAQVYETAFPACWQNSAAILHQFQSPEANRRRQAMTKFQELLRQWLPVADAPASRVMAALNYMHYHLEEPCEVSVLAQKCSMSERHFRRCFVEETGKTPKRYWDELRLHTALGLLRNRRKTLKEIAAELGYSSSFHLSNAIKARFGAAPGNLRRQPSDPLEITAMAPKPCFPPVDLAEK